MVTLDDYLMGRDKDFPPSEEQIGHAIDLIEKLRIIEIEFGHPLTITSGYRPPSLNATIPNSKPHDAHEKCQGVDLRDHDLMLSDFLLTHLELLEKLGLYMESPNSAKDHVHLQSYPPKSGRRVFIA